MSPLTEPTRIIFKKDPVLADPYYHNVSLLLHGDGTNGSTTIVDSSPTPKTVTAVGDAQISTAQSKFGGSSLAFDGTGDALTIPASADCNFGTGDFTIEAWVYPFTLTGSTIVGGRGPTAGTLMIAIEANQIRIGRNNIAWDSQTASLAWSAQWYHIAITKSAGTVFIFRDGTLLASAANSQNYNFTASADSSFAIGARQSTSSSDQLGSFFNGYIDDLRITKGIARYTSNFTPPTTPFPEVIG